MSPSNTAAAHKISKAKAALILERPFFATIVCTLPISEDTTLSPPTFATNGQWIKYHPDFVEECSLDEVKFVLCHEVGHVIFQHMFRRGHRDHRVWNMAGDYIINDLLVAEKIGSMPAGGLLNPGLVSAGNGTTEGVYDLLPPPDDSNGGKGGGAGDPMDSCEDVGGDASQVSQAQADMQVLVSQAAQAAKMCGGMSTALERFIDAALAPKVDWRSVLRQFVSARAKTEYSFARAKRRFAATDLFLPSLTGEAMGHIVLATDESGSVSKDEFDQCVAEINAIHRDLQPETTTIIHFTSRVTAVETFEREDEIETKQYATGGTAFSPIFREIDELGIEPVCVVVLTDLCCDDFGPMPPYPVLWVTTMKGRAPWGEIVEMHQNL